MQSNEFGERIKSIRKNVELSQKDLSEMTGIGREQISRIEQGEINVTLETITKLSSAFEMKLPELFDLKLFLDKTKPFVKWAGGKKQLLREIKDLIPKEFNTYFEPFVGGGALFFSLKLKDVVINDFNSELTDAYKCFLDESLFKRMIKELNIHEEKHSEEYYYSVREWDRQDHYIKLETYKKAARMIYLNKACFNGLFRVNSKGYFNVPSGKKIKVNAYDRINFDNIHNYFKGSNITILNQDFEKAVENAKQGDFVYFDPPYDKFESQDNFTAYSKESFGREEQTRLADTFKKLHEKKVYVMLSNHNTKFINELYSDFNIKVVNARRMINSDASKRGNVEEVIITNY